MPRALTGGRGRGGKTARKAVWVVDFAQRSGYLAIRILQVTLETRGLSLGFVLSQPPGGGGTNPMAAMSVAIAYRPERIVLLSDGEFDPTTRPVVTTTGRGCVSPPGLMNANLYGSISVYCISGQVWSLQPSILTRGRPPQPPRPLLPRPKPRWRSSVGTQLC